MKTKYFILGFVSCLIIFGVSMTGYLLGRSGSETEDMKEPQTLGDTLQAPISQSPSPSPKPTPTFETVETIIKQSLIDENYIALMPFIADKVDLTVQDTDCCGIVAAGETITRLDLLAEAQGIWDFNSNDYTASLEATYPERYADSIIGITEDFYFASFQLDKSNKIVKISIGEDLQSLVQ